jgi:hypothetical protein
MISVTRVSLNRVEILALQTNHTREISTLLRVLFRPLSLSLACHLRLGESSAFETSACLKICMG